MENSSFFSGKTNFKRPYTKSVKRVFPKRRDPSEEEKEEIKNFLEQESKKRKDRDQYPDPDNTKRPSGEGWFDIDDAKAYGSTGSLYGSHSEKSAIIIDNLEEEAKKAQKLDQVDYPERDLTINYNDGNAFRMSEHDCHIQFSLDSGTLTILHFICEGKENERNKGKALLLDVLEVLKDKRKLKFDYVELTAASLAPIKLREGKTIEDLIKTYRKMGFGPPEGADGKQTGTTNDLISTLTDYVRPDKGGFKKRKSKKRRKSIKKNYLKRRINTRRKSIRKRK